MRARLPSRSLLKLLSAWPEPQLCRRLCTQSQPRTQKLERIADELLSLTKLERYDYSILFRHKMGLNQYGPTLSGLGSAGSAAAQGADGKPAAAATEKTAFDIKLEKFDAASKIKVIKEVRAFTDLGLKDAAPLLKKLKEVGATVSLE